MTIFAYRYIVKITFKVTSDDLLATTISEPSLHSTIVIYIWGRWDTRISFTVCVATDLFFTDNGKLNNNLVLWLSNAH